MRSIRPLHPVGRHRGTLGCGVQFDYEPRYDIEDEEIGLSDRHHDPLHRTLRVGEPLARKVDWRRVIIEQRKLRVGPIGLTESEMGALYAGLCWQVMELCRGREATAFVSCDEAQNILKQSNFPTFCERLITGGRKHGVECLISASVPSCFTRR